MQAYRLRIFWLALFVIAYPAVSGTTLIACRECQFAEIYPIAPWTLFCFIPNVETDYAVRILEVDGEPLPQVRYFEDYVDLPDARKIVAHVTIQELGRLAHGGKDFSTLQHHFEQSFLRSIHRQVRYELVERQFDVLERYKFGFYHREKSLNELNYESSESRS